MKDPKLEVAQELRALEASAQQRQAARGARTNRRYVFNTAFNQAANTAVGTASGIPAIPQTAKVVIDRPFYAASLEACIRIVGSTSLSGGTTEQFNVPLGNGNLSTLIGLTSQSIFDFFWSLRDSFGDREWTKGKIPSWTLESSVLGPLQLPRRQFCPAGTEVTLEIEPLYVVIGTVSGEGYSVSVQAVYLEFSIVGYET